MGLDMYAYTAPAELVGDQQVDLGNKLFKDGNAVEGVETGFAYWRKFNHLHGWMERLYREKGGAGRKFNCDTLRLMPEDIDALEADMGAGNLTPTSGFFFGDSTLFPEDVGSLEDFIADSRRAFEGGLAVIYDSWW
jgi:hypothetical protein